MKVVVKTILCLVLIAVALIGQSGDASPALAMSPCADLAVTSFVISPSEPIVGQNAAINVTVKNQGSCSTVVGFVVQWKSAVIAPTGPSTFVPALAAGASTTVSFEYAFPTVGNFTTVVNLDTDNTVDESNESNNLAIKSVSVQPDLPDLVITGMSINPAQPVEGLNAGIHVTVKNQGSEPAGPFVVQWKSALSAPTGPNTQVPGLAAGASTTVSFEYAFPNDGNFTTAATVDTGFDVTESNEDNNLEIFPVTVQKATIDLIVTHFQIDPAPGVPVSEPPLPVQGRLSRATITVHNQGNFPAGDFLVQWKPTLFAFGLTSQVNGLEPGASHTLTLDYTYPFAGSFMSQVKVDSSQKVLEINELNNSDVISVTVEPPRPDLIITELSIDPAQPVRGLQATVTVKVKNRGNTPAGTFVVSWKPSPLMQGLSQQVNGLDVGQSTILTFDYTYPFPGQFTSAAQVDSTGWVRELDEGNNSQQLPVTVLVDTVDLQITDMTISPDPPHQGVPATVSITMKNNGNSPSGSFLLEWNPDSFGLITPSPSSLSSQIDNLDGGQTMSVNFSFTYPDAGTFRTVAKIDAFNVVDETNENNNLKILNVVVDARAPDLEITGLTMNPANPTQGQQVTVSAVVKNQGNLPAGQFVVEWNPDALGLITPSPATLASQVDGLNVGQSTTVRFNYVYPESGNFRSVAKADAFNNVAESNEANNLRILNVTVAPGIDLIITNLQIVPAEPIRGSKATARVTVKNTGIYPSDPFFVQWKLRKDDAGGPLGQVDGLNPGQSKVVEIEGTYFQTGDYETLAIADVFDQIVESNEDNNTSSIVNVTVKPRVTTLRVTFTNVHIHSNADDTGDLEWLSAFLIPEEGAKCVATIVIDPDIGFDKDINLNEDGFHCQFYVDNDTDPGDNLPVNKVFTVKIVESAPLLVLSAGMELDAADWGLKSPSDLAPDFGGFAFGLHLAGDRWGEGETHNIESQEGDSDVCGSGSCFDVTYTVEVIDEPPRLMTDWGAVAAPPPPYITLPDGFSRWLPTHAALPDGVRRIVYTYLPLVVK